MPNSDTDFLQRLTTSPDTATPVAADQLAFYDVSAGEMGKTTIGTLPIAQAQVTKGYRAISNDGAIAIVTTDHTIIIANSTTGTKAITTASSHTGQVVNFRLKLCTGNSYTLAVTGGALTMNAPEEAPVVVWTGAAWEVVSLNGATIV